jgi:streptomycin 6-kinase
MTHPTSHAIPKGFAHTIVELHQKVGVEWLNHLPALIADCAAAWSLTVFSPFEPLSYNYVAPGVRADGTGVVLKVGVPDRELLTEIAALRTYDGHGIVRLLDADPDRGVLLLERLWPGTPLFELVDDEQATAIAAEVMRQLWRPVPPDHPFPTVADWARGLKRLRNRFDGGTGPFPPTLVDRAEALFPELIASMDEPVVLHGDLHHWNVLRAEREPWLALDPKGVAGEPAYEVGALLRNPMPGIAAWPRLGQILARRVDQLAELLDFDRARLVSWGLAQAVLSAWWSIEDHGHGGEAAIAVATALAGLRGI